MVHARSYSPEKICCSLAAALRIHCCCYGVAAKSTSGANLLRYRALFRRLTARACACKAKVARTRVRRAGSAEAKEPDRISAHSGSVASHRLRVTSRLGAAFAITALLVIAVLQLDSISALRPVERLSVGIGLKCAQSFTASISFRSDGGLVLRMLPQQTSQNPLTDPEAVAAAAAGELPEIPEPLSLEMLNCVETDRVTVFFGDVWTTVPFLQVSSPPEQLEASGRVDNLRYTLIWAANYVGMDPPFQQPDQLSIEFRLFDRGAGWNPAVYELAIDWWAPRLDDYDAEVAWLAAERVRLTNACSGCLVDVSGTVLAPGQSTSLSPTLTDMSQDGELDAFPDFVQFDSWSGMRRFAALVRVDDPSRAARETSVLNLVYILLGAAFSLLTEAYLLSGLRRDKSI